MIDPIWTKEQETYLNNLSIECKDMKEIYIRSSKIAKRLYYGMAVPTVLLSTAMGITSIQKYNEILSTTCFFVIGALKSLDTLLNFGSQQKEFSNVANQFEVLENDIQQELVSASKNEPDVIIETFTSRFEKLKQSSPSTIC